MNIQEFRTKYPEYDHVGDQQLADALYKKHYSHVERNEFDAAFIGGQAKEPKAAPEGGSILHPLAQGATLGFADEIAAGGAALYGKLSGDHPDKSFGDIYRGVKGDIEQDTAAFSERNPKTALAAELAGGTMTGGAVGGRLFKELAQSPKLLNRAATGASIGAVEGGIYGAGTAREGERLEGAKSGAIMGAGIGAVAGPVAGKVSDVLEDRAAKLADIRIGSDSKELARFKETARGNLGADRAARRAIGEGFDEGLVQQIKTAQPADKDKLRQMINIAKLSLKSNRFAQNNRINKPIGESLKKRVGQLNDRLIEARDQLDDVAKSLKTETVDHSGPMNQFIADLQGMDVRFSDKGRVSIDFTDSMLEHAKDAQGPIKTLMNRMVNTKVPSAYDIHRLKRFIDNMVTYGKSQEKGLKGEALVAIKRLRHNLDAVLDDAFPEYNRVNTQYADNRQALDTLQEAWGGKVNMFRDNAENQLGIQSRKLLSNYTAGDNQKEAIRLAEDTIRKYGGKTDDSIMDLVQFESALRSVVPQKYFNTFQGDIEKAVGNAQLGARAAAGDKSAVFDAARKVVGKINEKTPEKALEALEALLK